MNYRTIKRLAREHNLQIQDLIALAPQNDPFYTGSKGELAKARWFADLWQRFGYGKGVHLRRIHYQAVSQDPPLVKPDGKVYENTLNDWGYLNLAAKYARYLNLVPASHFVDRRNPEAILYARYDKPDDFGYQDPTPGWDVEEQDSWDLHELPELPALPDLPGELPDLPAFKISGYWGIQQAHHVEVWAEKTTMNDVLIPLCKEHRVNLITGAGELSITAVLDLMGRVREADRPARILYISDYDPAGLGMPISVARKIEYFQRAFGYGDLDVCLEPVVLTAGQVDEYALPRVPVKDSDRRKANWIATQGAGQVELDALEALHPGELHRIVRDAVFDYVDPDLESRAASQRDELAFALEDARSDVLTDFADSLVELRGEYDDLRQEFGETRVRFAELVAEFQQEIDAHAERLQGIRERGQELYEDIGERMAEAEVDVDDYPLPEPDLPPESDDLLYDSDRDYVEQLVHYKAYRNGSENGD